MTDTPRIAILSAYDKVCTFLDNDSPDCLRYYDETLHTYLQGSAYTFEFTTFTDNDDAQYLVVGNKLSFRWKNKDYYLNIVTTEKQEYELKVTAYGLVFELLNEEVDAYEGSSLSFAQYIHDYGFEHSFTIGLNEVSDKRISHKWEGSETILARLYSTANVFDAELEFVTQLENDYSLKDLTLNVYRKHDDSHQGMGRDRRHEILRYGKEIRGIHKTSDVTELYTGIRPMGKDGLRLTALNGKKELDANGKVEYMVSGTNLLAPQARDRFPSTLITDRAPGTDMYIVKIWSYDTDNVNVLYGQALAELKKYVNPKVEYEIDGYIEAEIGDTFTVEDSEYTPALYLEARIVEQEISFTNVDKCRTTFDNFSEVSSKVSNELLTEMNRLIEENKTYQLVVSSSDGIVLPEAVDHTVLTAYVRDKGKDITDQFTIKWYVDSNLVFTGSSVTVEKSSLKPSVTYHVEALSALDIVKASYEVTVARLLNGADGVNSFLHIAYANSGDGLLDFSLTDSDRKFIGQYVDENKYDSEDPTKYRWSAIKGADGQSLVDYVEQFYYSTSKEEVTGGEWFESSPDWQEGKYLWKRYKAAYENPTETKYTTPVYDPTWNRLDEKLSEIQLGVDAAKNTSKEAVEKATEASDLSSEAKNLASSASTKADDAIAKAAEANTSTANANKEIEKINTAVDGVKSDIQGAVDKANANANEIATVKETYATKVDLSNSEKTIKADVSTEITKQIGELSTNISESYAAKTDLVTLEGSLKSEIKQNADNISSTVSRVESLETDTTQAKKDVADAIQKATAAKETADSAQADATAAKETADNAQSAVDEANKNLSTAQNKLTQAEENLTNVTGRVDATEKEIADAKEQVADAQAKVTQAQKDVESAKETANTAVSNAKTAQDTANDAKTKAEKAQQDVDNLTSRVTTAESKITQNEKSISLAVSETTKVNKKIDDLQIGGRNLLRNTAFNTFKYWNSINTKLEVVDGWCEFTIQGIWSGITQNFKPEKGVDYIISYEAYLVDTEATSAGLESDFGSPDNILSITKTPTKYVKKVPYPINASEFINFQLASNEIGKKWRIRNIKLEIGNKATDWTPAPEDVDNDLATTNNNVSNLIHTTTDLSAQLNVTKQSIQSNVSEISQIQNNIATMKKETSTSIEQTNKSISAVISSTNILQEKVNGSDETIKNINTNFGFDAEGMTIGKSDSHFKTKISNERFSFTENGNEVAYFANKKMYITDGQFTNSMRVGDFAFVPRANGSLDFKKVGGSN